MSPRPPQRGAPRSGGGTRAWRTMGLPLGELAALVLLSGLAPGGRTLCPTIDGSRLLLDGQPMFLKGVNWNPVPKGGQQRHSNEHFRGFIEADSDLMAAAGINAVRTYEPILDTDVLDTLWSKGIHVLNTVYITAESEPDSVLEPVSKLKDHPAILMWVVGNEWNYNQLYSTMMFEDAMARVHEVVDLIKSADPSHPVATVYGMMPSPEQIGYLDNVDVWGLTAYSGISFGNLFDLWSDRTQKPMFVAEFGADAYNELAKSEDEPDQAKATVALFGEIMAHATHSGGMCLGGLVFELADEWWKDSSGSPDSQEPGGVAPGGGPFPDGIFNEEYWGMVTNEGTPRQAFAAYAALYPPEGSTYAVHEERLPVSDVTVGFRLRACGASPGCRRMIGNCCPTANGTFLACCSGDAKRAAKAKKRVVFPEPEEEQLAAAAEGQDEPAAEGQPEPPPPEQGPAPPQCQMGEEVSCCPDGDCATCAGDQCCPGSRGSVSCPSGSSALVDGCIHPKLYDCTGQTGIHPPPTTTATNTTTHRPSTTTTTPTRSRATPHSPKKSGTAEADDPHEKRHSRSGRSDGEHDVDVPPGAWMLGPEKASCDQVCKEAGGCVEGGWPADADAFMEIVGGLGADCEDLQEGRGAYDPSSRPGRCGWRASGSSAKGNATRCAARAPAHARRFCPCRAAPSGLEEVTLSLQLRKLQDPADNGAAKAPGVVYA